MPPRNPELPEGTDHIINGAMDTGAGGDFGGGGGGTSGGAGGSTGSTTDLGGGTSVTMGSSGSSSSGGGFVASSGGDDTGGTSMNGGTDGTGGTTAQKIVGAAKSQVSTLTDQATGKIRDYADQGKDRATSALDDFAEVINDAARSIDERLGSQYGEYAHRAAGAVTSLSQNLRGKTVDELLDDSRGLVRKSPGVAIGAAALIGFTLVRLVKAGLDDGGEVGFTADRGRNIDFQPDTGGTSARSA